MSWLFEFFNHNTRRLHEQQAALQEERRKEFEERLQEHQLRQKLE